METRRGFLAALTVVCGIADIVPMPAESRAQAVKAPPVPKRFKRPSAAALAFAATCRSFDPRLTDAELTSIARSIDAARKAAGTLQSKTKPLRNSDEMVARFAADEVV